MTDLGPVDRMRELIEANLDQDSGGELLAAWLQGFKLPLVGIDEEPYVWILRGLAEVPERTEAEQTLALWAAEILDSEPDVQSRGTLPDRLLGNLLLLSAGLASPDQLSEPLLRMYRRKKLAGEFRGVDFRSMLRSALATNQRTAELEVVWTEMALGRGNGFLPGNTFNGFEGLTLMPDPDKGEGYPAVEAIGVALGHQAELLAGEENRTEEFEALIDRVTSLYPGIRLDLLQHLVQISLEDGWPQWCLGALTDKEPKKPDGKGQAATGHNGYRTSAGVSADVKARAEFLEDQIRAKIGEERQPLFDELCRLYADDLQALSIKWAYARRLRDPTRDGPTALSRSLIILKKKHEDLDFEERSLLYHFKDRIWSELSHIKNERLRSIQRYETLPDDFGLRSPVSGPEERLRSKEQLRQVLKDITSNAQRRILQAGMLKEEEGYSWEEAARAVGWEGSKGSLRTSFARLKKHARKNHEAESHSADVHSKLK